MEKETVFRKVLCKDRFPEKNEYYVTSKNILFFDTDEMSFFCKFKYFSKPEWWLEEIPISQIKAEALGEGYNSGIIFCKDFDAQVTINEYYGINQPLPQEPINPYR
jgi:hypothetical protein